MLDSKSPLEQKYVDAIIDATTSPSPEVDQFSTWLIGGAAASIALSISSLENLTSNIGQGITKAFLVFLSLSILLGLAQKIIAIQISAAKTVDKAAEAALAKIASAHSEEAVRDASKYMQENADTANIIVGYISAFPAPLRAKLTQSLGVNSSSKPKYNVQISLFKNQIQILGAQILSIFIAIGLVIHGI
nr:hypothetical protein [Pseudomonas sp. A46]